MIVLFILTTDVTVWVKGVVVRRETAWQRARVEHLGGAGPGRVAVFLLDQGCSVTTPLAGLRTGVHSQLAAVPPLALPFFLGEVVPPGGEWSKPAIEFVSDAVVGAGLVVRAVVVSRGRGHTFLRLHCPPAQQSLSHHMVQCGMAVLGTPSLERLPAASPGPAPAPAPSQASATPRSTLFRPMTLETGVWYPIFLASTEGGPADFCVQLEVASNSCDS